MTILIACGCGIVIGWVLAQPTKELDNKGPLIKRGQGDYEIDIFA